MSADPRVIPFREASRELAEAAGLPIITPSGSFVSDARAAWALERVEAHQVATQEPRHDPGWFHASSLGYDDARMLREYAGIAGDRHSARTLRIFGNGHERDASWKRYFHDAGLSIFPSPKDEEARRVRIWPIRLTGRCDDAIRDPETGEEWVVEFKTINPSDFNALREPKPEHRQQITVYMAGLNIPRGIVLYEHKGNQQLKAFAVDLDVDIWIGIHARCKRLLAEASAPVKARVTPEGRAKAAALQV